MKKDKNNKTFPPTSNQCPDFWTQTIDSNNNDIVCNAGTRNINAGKVPVNVYTKDLMPEVNNLSKLKYEEMEVIKDGDKERLCQYVVKEERKKYL